MRRTSIRLVVSGAVVCAALVWAGCGGGTSGTDPKALEGVEWTLVESSMSSVDLGAAGITANFDGEKIYGFSGVNQYGGPYTAKDDGTLEIGELASTMMAGPEPLMKAEQAYLELLKGCDGYQVEGDTLTLLTGEKSESLVYEKAAEVTLPGTSWNVTSYNNGKGGVTTLVAGSELTLEFGEDGTVAGNGGVNRFNGPYEVDGAGITIGPLALTKMAGEPALMEQESAFVKALESATKWKVVRGTLELRDADGSAMVFADPAQ
jgi:heat shock protein HslJ